MKRYSFCSAASAVKPATRSLIAASLCVIPTLLITMPLARGQWTPSTTWSVTIVLPPKLVAGRPATLAVLGADAHLAADVTVDLGNNQHVRTDATGRAFFTVPASGGFLVAKAAGTSSVALVDANLQITERPALKVAPVISIQDRFTICGSGFRGDADANRVKINDGVALVMAASPECLVAFPGPMAMPGPAKITVEAPGMQWTGTTTLVSLQFEAPRPALTPGKRSRLGVRVIGSGERLRISVVNQTPGVLRFAKGDTQELVTSGGAQNLAELEVESIGSGDFSFRARLVPIPDAELSGRYLQVAANLAPAYLQKDVKNLAERLQRHPGDIKQARRDLGKILSVTISGDFRTLLDAAFSSL
jgi:hypothetical protein